MAKKQIDYYGVVDSAISKVLEKLLSDDYSVNDRLAIMRLLKHETEIRIDNFEQLLKDRES
mgnify:CR=1 FL=1